MSMSLPWQMCKTTFKPNEQKTVKKNRVRDLNVWKRLSYNEERKVGLLVFGFTFFRESTHPLSAATGFFTKRCGPCWKKLRPRVVLETGAQLMMINFI